MEPQETLIWKSEPPQAPESMVSVSIGRAIITILGARSRKLHDAISRLSPDSNKRPSLGTSYGWIILVHLFFLLNCNG